MAVELVHDGEGGEWDIVWVMGRNIISNISLSFEPFMGLPVNFLSDFDSSRNYLSQKQIK